MENEKNLELEPVQTEETGGEPEVEPQKKELTPEQELGIKKRNFTRLAKELGVELPKREEKSKAPQTEKTEFDDTENLFLDVKQVPEEDRSWLFDEMKATGKSLRQVVGFRYVADELKTRKESRESERALPDSKGRVGAPPKDSFDHWWSQAEAGKVTVSQVPDPKIRKQIIEKRIADDRAKRGRK